MKKSLILSALLLAAAVPAFATVGVYESTTPEFLYNGGYSSEAIRLIQYNKSYANGESLRSQEQNKSRKRSVWTKFLDYIDPGRDDGKFFNRDLQLNNPGYDDL